MNRTTLLHRPVTLLTWLLAASFSALPARAQSLPTSPPADEPTRMPSFDVTTSQDKGYISTNAESATRLDVPLSDIPQSVTVFNQQFLLDVLALDIGDVAMYDPSFTSSEQSDTFTARGIGGTGATSAGSNYLNGFPQTASFGQQTVVNAERVEVLKGPNAVLYGTGAFGGTINRVTKKPLPKQQTTMRAQIDSNELWTTTVDITGPINSPLLSRVGKFGYRFNGLYSKGYDYRGVQKGDRVFAPTLSWEMSQRTKVIFDYVFQRQQRSGMWEFPIHDGDPTSIVVGNGTRREVDYSNFYGDENDQRIIRRHIGNVDFRHQFSERLQFRSMFNLEFKDTLLNEVIPDGTRLVITPTTAFVPRQYRTQDQDTDNWRARNELAANFITGPFAHRMILGQSWDRQGDQIIRLITAANNGPTFNPNLFSPADIFINHPGNITGPLPPLAVNTYTKTHNENYSYYFSDLTALFKGRMFVQVGGRTLRASRDSTDVRVNGRRVKSWDEATLGSAGVVYHLRADKGLSVYVNYNGTFVPNFVANPDGYQLPPMRGAQKEAGLKFTFSDRLSGLVSVYDIRQTNVPTDAPELGDGYQKVIDGLHSRGAELNLNANISKEWSVFGGYAYTDSRGKVTPTQLGGRHFRAPVDGISAFSRYAFSQGPLARLSFSVGVIWRSESLPQFLATPRSEPMWKVPDYFRLDSTLAYGLKLGKRTYHLALRVRNLTDKATNYMNTSNLRASAEAPREWILALDSRL